MPGNDVALGYRRSHVTLFRPAVIGALTWPPNPPRPPRPCPPPSSPPTPASPPAPAASPPPPAPRPPPPRPPLPAAAAAPPVNDRTTWPLLSRISITSACAGF